MKQLRTVVGRLGYAVLGCVVISASVAVAQQDKDKIDYQKILTVLENKPSVTQSTAKDGTPGAMKPHAVNALNSPIPCVAELAMVADRARVNFVSASHVLSRNAKEGVLVLASMAQKCPQAQVIIEGFADPIGNADYNLSLSWRRANAVLSTIESAGFSTMQFVAHSHLTNHNDAVCKHFDVVDRRVEFLVISRALG